jgi:hypothetical protein
MFDECFTDVQQNWSAVDIAIQQGICWGNYVSSSAHQPLRIPLSHRLDFLVHGL